MKKKPNCVLDGRELVHTPRLCELDGGVEG